MRKLLIKNETKRALNTGIIILFFLGGLFLISKSSADGSSADLIPPTTQPRTQTEIWAGLTQSVIGELNNLNKDSSRCGSLGQYYALRSLSQNTINSFTDVTYWEFHAWGELLVWASTHTATEWLLNPPSYDLRCWVNEPQVDWKDVTL